MQTKNKIKSNLMTCMSSRFLISTKFSPTIPKMSRRIRKIKSKHWNLHSRMHSYNKSTNKSNPNGNSGIQGPVKADISKPSMILMSFIRKIRKENDILLVYCWKCENVKKIKSVDYHSEFFSNSRMRINFLSKVFPGFALVVIRHEEMRELMLYISKFRIFINNSR